MAVFLGSWNMCWRRASGDDWFQSQTIVLFSVLVLLGACLFFYRAFTAAQPVVDLKAYRDRNFAVGSILTFMLGMVLYGLTYLYPLFSRPGARLQFAADRRNRVRHGARCSCSRPLSASSGASWIRAW